MSGIHLPNSNRHNCSFYAGSITPANPPANFNPVNAPPVSTNAAINLIWIIIFIKMDATFLPFFVL